MPSGAGFSLDQKRRKTYSSRNLHVVTTILPFNCLSILGRESKWTGDNMRWAITDSSRKSGLARV
ncbi:hypothetical protein E4T47_09416 [Aureobasidium subglaciale]|nr:hypothetical protein E4T47_09416 [Aureobasidium subglaciale]